MSDIGIGVGVGDIEPGNSEAQMSSKRSRKKSIVWEHFTVESVANGCKRACCKRCKQTFAYSSGSKVAGTSHLKRHLALGTCPKNRLKEQKQLTLYTPGKSSETATEPPKKRHRATTTAATTTTTLPDPLFDQKCSRLDMAKMMIMHEYPLQMVEHPAFISFVHSLQPRFLMINVNTVEADCMEIYQKEKQNVLQSLVTVPGRISLSLDLWTSSQALGYVGLTGHFIDNDWRLHRRSLNFVLVPSHTSNAVSDAIGICLLDWNMETKLFSLTFDNCSISDSGQTNLRDHMSKKNSVVLNGRLFVVRCFANVLNLVVQAGVEAIGEIVHKVRESVKYVQASRARKEKFAEIVQHLHIPGVKSLPLDVPTQWNTTYVMLAAALGFKQAFSYLETCDSNYDDAPSVDDWKRVETFCMYLKVLYDAANIFSTIAHPTANMYFQEVWKIQLELADAAMSQDLFISTIAQPMYEHFSKYWVDCSLVIAIAVVMDPRFKMKLVEFSFSKIYGENASSQIKIVTESIHQLYLEYVAQPLPLTPAYAEQGASDNSQTGTFLPNSDVLLGYDVYISEISSSQQPKSELDLYLEEAVFPRIQDFDILNWWKLNEIKYPTVSKMARDILAIPMLTVASESIFNAGDRVLDHYRSSLRPETVEAVICAKDWLQPGSVDSSNALLRLEY